MALALNLAACAANSQPAAGYTLEQATQAALADAAQRGSVAVTALSVTSAEPATWRDGSLGCPEPDRMYTMALVPGYRIRIQSGSQSLDYHASARGALLLCPPGRAQDPLPGLSRI
jgi:hypothetical protein